MLLALEALGLLSSDQAAAWRRRFELAAEGWSPGPAASSEQRQLADAHLRRLVGSLREATDTPARRGLLDRLNGAFCLCLQTGLVDPADAPDWGTRVEQALGQTLEQFESAEADEGLAREELQDFPEPQDPDEPGFKAPEPMGAAVRVVPAEPARHEGLCVTAVALHEGGFEVHWHSHGEQRHDPDGGLTDEGFEATDDLGTEYRSSGAGASFGSYSEPNGPYLTLGETECAPAVPKDARELRIRWVDYEWVVRLS
jgi:hypothetical protein